MASITRLPSFDSLTIDLEGPRGNAWGLFGDGNELGMLNLLTPAVVAQAGKEIRDGVRISLDWDLNQPEIPNFNRQPFRSEMIHKHPRSVNDDILTFNTQCSSQWDGFRHFGNQKLKLYFNGNTQEDLQRSTVLGIDASARAEFHGSQGIHLEKSFPILKNSISLSAWSKAGGIAGRGVLLDWASWAERKKIPYSNFESSHIPLSGLQTIAAETDISFGPGDILFVRSGYTQSYNGLSSSERLAISQRSSPDFLGVQAGEETLRWL
ncbi:uncharacterized protein Z518_10245 [Rhinocladiella mackenziei CBS 650.93]|uniref:Uncharacterized protein n=1 Tax=Rhinocladiella mackenziei CBS 650.93 TaxID=1442369 RepID=A0A0D2GP44_9EURO|nr:uncharacterized protein Z518_10245 [Rhinocladiella mackenziei CBS 650.93]KIX00108.1 hypothetical protein Z518_10245 [Rhinocladiella mackenziei CBS 650.93]